MRAQPIIYLAILFSALVQPVAAQTYTIRSFEGIQVDVNFYYRPGSEKLVISCLQDTLVLDDYWAMDTVKILDRVFLQLNYSRRGGSNEGFGSLILLYFSNGRLGEALNIESYSNWDMRPANYLLFTVDAQLTGHDVDSYQLKLTIHDERRSKLQPRLDNRLDKVENLSFDKRSRCFYSHLDPLRGVTVPVVTILKNTYSYVNGHWKLSYAPNTKK